VAHLGQHEEVTSGTISGNHRLQPFGQVHHTHPLRSVGTVKGIADNHMAQICTLLKEAVEQVQKQFQIVMGIAGWTWAIGFYQAFAFGWRHLIRSLYPRNDEGKQSPPCVRISGFRLSGLNL
jgi:hypothetical protein